MQFCIDRHNYAKDSPNSLMEAIRIGCNPCIDELIRAGAPALTLTSRELFHSDINRCQYRHLTNMRRKQLLLQSLLPFLVGIMRKENEFKPFTTHPHYTRDVLRSVMALI